MVESNYYIIDKNQQAGPYTKEELKQMRLHPNTPVWKEGPNNWIDAKDIKGLVKKEKAELYKTILIIALVSVSIITIFWLFKQLLL